MLLKRFFIAYNGQTQPSPDFQGGYTYEPGFRESHTQAIANRYVDNLLQSGGSDGNGGSESLTDFKRRGPYHKFLWHKDYDEKPTHVTVNAQFSEPFGAAEQQCTNHGRTGDLCSAGVHVFVCVCVWAG